MKSPACGWCHAGSGPGEYGRKADGSVDYSMNLIEGEKRNVNPLDGDYSARSTPDNRSHFLESGVLEADCFICHSSGYDFGGRNKEIVKRNYRWAATVGARMGEVQGAVFTYAKPDAEKGDPDFWKGTWNFDNRPIVRYDWGNRNIFTLDGRLQGFVINRQVPPGNCLQCHKGADTKKVGWLWGPEYDAHAKAGLICTDCHVLSGDTAAERIKHNISKGWHPLGSVQDSTDGKGIKTCVGCHIEGDYTPTRKGMPEKASDPTKTHAEKFPNVPFHFQLIQCTGCHSNREPARGGYIIDMSTGSQVWYTPRLLAINWAPDFTKPDRSPWAPWFARYDARNGLGRQYLPVVPKVVAYFAQVWDTGELRPIELRHVKKAFKAVKDRITWVTVKDVDGKDVQRPTVAGDDDIRIMTEALNKLGFDNVVFVSDKVYRYVDGKVTSHEDRHNAHSHDFPVHHNVQPLNRKDRAGKRKPSVTYGSKGQPEGCRDCHRKDSPVFSRMLITNVGMALKNGYPTPGKPYAIPVMEKWGMDKVPIPKQIEEKKTR